MKKKKPYTLTMFDGVVFRKGKGGRGPKAESGFYWHVMRNRGGKIVMDGSESYDSASNLRRAVKALPLDWSKISVVDETKGGAK
jgi:hypothetical protein